MSVKATSWAWDRDLPTTEKFVLVALADYADENNSCFPGHKTLAARIGASVSTVSRALKGLAERGYVVVERRHRTNGSRTSDRYALAVGRVEFADLSTEDRLPVNLQGGDLQHSNLGAPTRQIDAPRTSKRTVEKEEDQSRVNAREADRRPGICPNTRNRQHVFNTSDDRYCAACGIDRAHVSGASVVRMSAA